MKVSKEQEEEEEKEEKDEKIYFMQYYHPFHNSKKKKLHISSACTRIDKSVRKSQWYETKLNVREH